MKILFNQSANQYKQLNLKNIANTTNQDKVQNLNNLPEKRDLVSFRALTKAKLKGFDLAMIEKLKAPLQNFRDAEHIQRWAGARFLGLGFEKIKSRTKQGLIEKNTILKEWYKYLETGNDAYPNTLKYLIYSSLLAGLSANDDKLPPSLNQGVLADTVTEIEKELENNPKTQFNFIKKYTDNLKKLEMNIDDSNVNNNLKNCCKGSFLDSTGTGWVMIPSLKNDPENFDKNVEKLQALSHNNWCTSSYNARPYLEEGDFHVYLENGKPKLGVRFRGDSVVEIQGEKNNSKIPGEYFDIFKAHQQELDIKLKNQAAEEVDRIERVEPLIKKIREELGDTIEIKSVEDAEYILDYFGVKHKRTPDNLLVIPEYQKIGFNGVHLNDIGCEEDNLFNYIEKIEGDADFSGCELKPFKNLTEIGGNVLLDNYANLENFGSLKRIGGSLTLKECYLDSLGDLEYIGGNFVNKSEYIKNFGKVKEIGGDVDFSEFDTTEIKGLERVRGNAYFSGSKLRQLGSLKRIDGNVNFDNAWVDSLKNLEHIGGDLTLEDSEITTFGKLKTVKGNVELTCSLVEDLGKLEHIEGDFNIHQCRGLGSLVRNSNLKQVDGDVYLGDTSVSEFDFYDIVTGKIYDEDKHRYFVDED